MRRIVATVFLIMAVSCANAQWLGGLGAAADSASKGIDRHIEYEQQKELLELRYKLETEREIAEIKRRHEQQEAQGKVDGEAYLEKNHPGWRSTIRTKSFADWRAKQSKSVNDLGASNRYEDASVMLYLYEASLSPQAK